MALFKKEKVEEIENTEEITLEEELKIEALEVEKAEVLPLNKENYGPFYEYVIADDVTDIDYNGHELWITYTNNKREKIEEHGVTDSFIKAFSQRVANKVSKPFNKQNNLLEAETETLRISILHESAAPSGRSLCLRKTPIKVRMSCKSILKDNYMPKEIMCLLANCVKAHMNFNIVGEPGAGKTELAKFISQFIPAKERAITIEDSPEWHYRAINPGKDCVEMRVNEGFSYAKAIKTCLRQNPSWIMLSEARSVEAKFLIESWSTGVNGITTLHTDDIRKIPSRYLNMMANRDDADRLENDIYEFCNIALLVRKKARPDGTAYRYVDQMGFLYKNKDGSKDIEMLVKNGELINRTIPEELKAKLDRAEVKDYFANAEVERKLE